MKISVIIPTLGDRAQLGKVLEALSCQSFPSDEFEILLIGNEGSAALRAFAESWKSRFRFFRLEFTGVRGVNEARNLGVTLARGRILVFLDDDCIPRGAYYLRTHAEIHEENPDAIAVGGIYVPVDRAGKLARAYIRTATHWLEASRFEENSSINLLGGNVSYKLSRLGERRFNPRITFGGAETEFHARLVLAGERMVLSDRIPVEHDTRMSLSQFLRRAYLQGYHRQLADFLGKTPKFRSFDSRPKKSRDFLERLYIRAFDLGREWCRISAYEDRRSRKLVEYVRLRIIAMRNIVRSSLWLRQLCYGHRFLSEERRRRLGERALR